MEPSACLATSPVPAATSPKITGAMPDGWLCRKHSSYGSTCYRGREHEGPHMSEWNHTWTDQSDAAAAKQIVASMKGKTE